MLIIFAGALLRIYLLDWENLGYGEVETLQAVQEYAKGNFVNNFYIFDVPPFEKYLFTLSYLTIGNIEVALRLVALLFGVLSIFAVYKLAEMLYDRKTALLAATITAFSILHLQFSRYAQFETALGFFYLLTLFFLWKVVRKNDKRAYIFLGVSMGLGMLTKYNMLFAIVTVVVYALMRKSISVRIRKRFSLEIDNSIIKAFAVAVIVFFLLWPFAFTPMKTNIKIDVQGRGIDADVGLPMFLLSIGKRFTNTFVHGPSAVAFPFNVPIIDYFSLFLVKESLLFVALFFAGLYALYRMRKEADRFIFTAAAIFFLLLSLQTVNYTYRNLAVAAPILAIVAASSLRLIKKEQFKNYAIAVVGLVFLANAALGSPSYALYYNQLNSIINVPESEGRFSEGLRELNTVLGENCKTFYGDPFYIFMLQPYSNNTDKVSPECFIFNDFSDNKTKAYVQQNNCSLLKTITKQNVNLLYVYRCRSNAP
jgi:4-amino-4-deoxy-L-arabinose transferase-like glycosyltransferase